MEKLIRELLEGIKDAHTVQEILDAYEIPYGDETEESGYLNLKVPVKDGMIRVYQQYRTKEIVVQKWTKARMKYSGIPVFMPGGRDTLAKAF